jgi:hypothetical protein
MYMQKKQMNVGGEWVDLEEEEDEDWRLRIGGLRMLAHDGAADHMLLSVTLLNRRLRQVRLMRERLAKRPHILVPNETKID